MAELGRYVVEVFGLDSKTKTWCFLGEWAIKAPNEVWAIREAETLACKADWYFEPIKYAGRIRYSDDQASQIFMMAWASYDSWSGSLPTRARADRVATIVKRSWIDRVGLNGREYIEVYSSQ